MSEAGLVASALWELERACRERLGAPLDGPFTYAKWSEVSGGYQARYLEQARLILDRLEDKREGHSSADLPDLSRAYRGLLKRWLNKLDRSTSGPDVDETKLALMDASFKKAADALDKLSAVEVRIKREALEEWARMSVRDKTDRMLQEIQSWPEGAKDEFRERFEVACPSRKLKAVR